MATASPPGVVVAPVRDRASEKRFIRFPWRIYADDPAWVAPLDTDVRKLLRPDHPFHAHADVEFFLALRDGEPVGRIAAVVNHLYNDFHEARTGFFGLFECVDDQAVANALLETAEDWLRDRAMTEVMGPFNLSSNDELYSPGILLDNYDAPPVLMMAYNPPYYPRLIETAGWEKAKDLLAYWLNDATTPPARLVRGVERLTGSIEGLEVRSVDLKHLDREVELIKEVYNSAWDRNWGFVPLTDEEIQHLARSLKPVVDPRYTLLALADGEPIAFAIALPDYNQALRHIKGRLFPFGLLKLLWYRRKISRLRVLTLGVKPEYRKKGVDALLYLRIYQNGIPAGLGRGEASWILEDNWGMRRAMERMGGHVYKTYRVYQKAL